MARCFQVLRFVMLIIALPIINTGEDTLDWAEVTVLGWSGLRGAVGLALGLSVYYDKHLHDVQFRIHQFFHIGSVVLLTVTLQGSTMKLLLQVSPDFPGRMATAGCYRILHS